jgi:ATP phosphoribosyltransferase regulatory subunit
LPLLAATGPFADAVEKLRAIDAGGALASRIRALEAIASNIAGRANVTLDPTERHGFEYQSWFGFTIFAKGYSAALGRGGTYYIDRADGPSEPATGFSLYPDPFIDLADEDPRKEKSDSSDIVECFPCFFIVKRFSSPYISHCDAVDNVEQNQPSIY